MSTVHRYRLEVILVDGFKYDLFVTLPYFMKLYSSLDKSDTQSYSLYDEDKVILKWNAEEGFTF